MAGFEINWSATSNAAVTHHPLYQRFNMTSLDTITVTEVKAAMGAILPTTESAAIISYLSWLLRCKALLA